MTIRALFGDASYEITKILKATVRGDDLLFGPQEVERFFAGAQDLGINFDEIDAIYQRTEGWPAALQLFRLTLNSPLVRKSLGGETAHPPSEQPHGCSASRKISIFFPAVNRRYSRADKLHSACRPSAPLEVSHLFQMLQASPT